MLINCFTKKLLINKNNFLSIKSEREEYYSMTNFVMEEPKSYPCLIIGVHDGENHDFDYCYIYLGSTVDTSNMADQWDMPSEDMLVFNAADYI